MVRKYFKVFDYVRYYVKFVYIILFKFYNIFWFIRDSFISDENIIYGFLFLEFSYWLYKL